MSSITSAAQRAYEHVRSRLAAGDFEPGARLVTRSLAQELGISLNPVREALNRLASERLVEHVPGAGTFVRRLNAQEIRDLYGLREAIECYAVAEAIRHISRVELEELDGLCAEWGALVERMRGQRRPRLPREELDGRWADREERFHRILVDAARNRLLSQAVADHRLLAAIFQEHRQISLAIDFAVVEQVHRVHAELVDAVRRGDEAAAREQVASMLRVGCRYVIDHLPS